MGCDIHLHTEVKRNGVWLHHSEAKVSRNYALFAKMADVRNDFGIEPFLVRGFPEDATELTLLDKEKYGIDGHSHSWLNARQICILCDFIESHENPEDWFGDDKLMWYYRNLPYFMGNRFDGFIKYPGDWKPYGIEDVRFVFFFGN